MDGAELKLKPSPLMAVNVLHDEEFDFREDLLLLPRCTYWEGVLFTVSPKEVTLLWVGY